MPRLCGQSGRVACGQNLDASVQVLIWVRPFLGLCLPLRRGSSWNWRDEGLGRSRLTHAVMGGLARGAMAQCGAHAPRARSSARLRARSADRSAQMARTRALVARAARFCACACGVRTARKRMASEQALARGAGWAASARGAGRRVGGRMQERSARGRSVACVRGGISAKIDPNRLGHKLARHRPNLPQTLPNLARTRPSSKIGRGRAHHAHRTLDHRAQSHYAAAALVQVRALSARVRATLRLVGRRAGHGQLPPSSCRDPVSFCARRVSMIQHPMRMCCPHKHWVGTPRAALRTAGEGHGPRPRAEARSRRRQWSG